MKKDTCEICAPDVKAAFWDAGITDGEPTWKCRCCNTVKPRRVLNTKKRQARRELFNRLIKGETE
jgi:hypothetical protein